MTDAPTPTTWSGPPLALAMAGAVAVLLLPLPSAVLDVLLTAQLAAAVVILWIAATAPRPARLSALPVALLASTLLRLALNVATTRAILSRAEAGRVIDAFGDALVGGDLVVGLAVFAVVTIAQYVVIARGAGRVAEVAARFALDALPGRQQAIEAELAAGTLDPEGARLRRDALSRTSGLYGAMDGVMRFVRGDALAGLAIVLVDIVGGLLVGVGQRGLDPHDALATYTVLTVGDGLASQVPAVLGTAAAAVLAVRLTARDDGRAPDRVGLWSTLWPALGGAAAVFGLLAAAPGLPGWPLATVSAGLALGAHRLRRSALLRPPLETTPEEERIEPGATLTLHPAALAALAGGVGPVLDHARRLALDFGLRPPPVAIVAGATDVPPGAYRIAVRGVPRASGVVMAGHVFVCPCPEDRGGLAGRHPVSDAPGRWVPSGAGLPPGEFVALHLAATWRRDRAALGMQAVAARIERIERQQPALVRAVVPRLVGLQALAVLLRRLLAEDLPVRDLPRILEALAEQPAVLDPDARLAALRRALRPWLTARIAHGPWLATICMAADLERTFAGGLAGGDTTAAVLERVDAARAAHPRAVLVVDDRARRAVRDALGEHRPGLPVVGHREIDPAVATRVVGFVDLG